MNDLGTSPEQATVRLERLLPGPIERVWAYLTESDKRATWFAGGTFDLRVGGRADLHFDHSNISSEKKPPDEHKNMKSDWVCRITRLEPPRLLSYTFDPAGPESEVTFELEPRGKDVMLVITHRRLADRKMMVGVASGWDAHVAILADRLNGVEPRPFWTTHARLKREYEARL
ncbi:MAG TPA: SRPBCC family protein [Gemmatimonadaceae bacterium]|nr:SRPBCC family protein [Gemmatimonadaceae bacterium]